MSPEPHGLHRAPADRAGEAVRNPEVPVHARQDRPCGVPRAFSGSSKNVVPESPHEVEEISMSYFFY